MTDRPDLAASTRSAPTPWPMAAPWTALVAITDTNALLRRACHEVRHGPDDNIFRGLAATGRSNTFVAAHVPTELLEYLPVVADQNKIRHAAALATLRGTIMPGIPVVDLPIRDFMHPRIRPLLSADPALPKQLRGDPDDAGTAALAEFLAPTIIVSADSVFERLGISGTAAAMFVQTARDVIRNAGYEASFTEAAALVDIGVRTIGLATSQAVRGLRSHPVVGAAIIGAVLWAAYRYEILRRDRVADGLRSLGTMVGPIMEATSAAIEERQVLRQGLRAVEPYGPATVEQVAARLLARCGKPLTPGEIRDQLRRGGTAVPAAVVKRAVQGHPAFLRLPGDLYSLGAPMVWGN